MLTAMKADMCSMCLMTEPWVRSFMRRCNVPQPLLEPQSKSIWSAVPPRTAFRCSKLTHVVKATRGLVAFQSGARLVGGETQLSLQCAVTDARDRVSQMAGKHRDACSYVYFIEQMGDVTRPHPNATVTGRTANQSFHRCAVNVNGSFIRASVASLQAAQPQNSRDDRVASPGGWTKNFTNGNPRFEHSAEGCVRSDFGCDLDKAQWCGVTAGAIPDAEFRGRDRELSGRFAVLDQSKFLVGDADDDCRLAEGVCGGAKQKCKNSQEEKLHSASSKSWPRASRA